VITVADPTRYTIVFNEDGTANIKADCNSVGATYTAGEDSSMTITLGPTTLVACPADSQADTFLAGLPNVVIYSFIEGDLVLDQPVDSGAMRFRAAGGGGTGTPPTEGADTLTGVSWEWVSTTTPTEEITVADPTRYTIIFNEDGTAGIKADCNVGNAEYTTGESGEISIVLGVFTLAFCEDSQDQQFRNGLSSAASYLFQDGDLYIDMMADGGRMRFRPAGGSEAGTPGEGGTETVPAGDVTLTSNTWQWVSTTTPTETITVADPTRYEITFNEDGTAGIKADCNVGGATYTAGEDGTISIVLGVSTLAFCVDSQDQQFRTGLASAAVYFFQDGNLFIDMTADAGTMQVRPATTAGAGEPDKGETGAPGNLVGTVWQLTLISTTGGNLTVNDPTRYTITFNEDGTANITADCNVLIATYVIGEGNTLTITPGITTLALCPPGSLDQIYLGGLTNAMGYRLEEGNLIIDLLYESGSMVFMPAS
jgi:heat shock protein HslJ